MIAIKCKDCWRLKNDFGCFACQEDDDASGCWGFISVTGGEADENARRTDTDISEQLEKIIGRNKLTYCENCKENVPYNIKELPMNGTVRNKEYHYTGKEAYCNICGTSVYMREINDINLDNLYNEFRKQNRKHKQ